MLFASLLAFALPLAAAADSDPTLSVTAHPVGLIALPLAGDDAESNVHAQIDLVHKPASRLAPVAHLALTRIATDIDEFDDFENSTIFRYALEVGARWRFNPERGWYAEATLGYLIETYDSKWLESVKYNRQAGTRSDLLYGDVQNTFQQPYAMVYAGWASDPSRRLRWDVGVGLGFAILGGTDDLVGIEWTGDPSLAGKDHSVDLFAAAPLVFDFNFGVGVNF